MVMDKSAFLAKAAANWDNTVEEVKKGSMDNPPDGIYVMRIAAAELTESKKQQAMIKIVYVILEGELHGRQKTQWINLEGDKGLQPFGWWLQRLGIKLEDVPIAQLEQFLEELVAENLAVKVDLKTTPPSDYQNTYIQGVLETYEPQDIAVAAPKAAGPYPPSNGDAGEVEAEDDDEGTLSVGDKVKFVRDGKPLSGVVKSADDQTEQAVVTVGKKDYEVSFSDLTFDV